MNRGSKKHLNDEDRFTRRFIEAFNEAYADALHDKTWVQYIPLENTDYDPDRNWINKMNRELKSRDHQITYITDTTIFFERLVRLLTREEADTQAEEVRAEREAEAKRLEEDLERKRQRAIRDASHFFTLGFNQVWPQARADEKSTFTLSIISELAIVKDVIESFKPMLEERELEVGELTQHGLYILIPFIDRTMNPQLHM
jgi:hypothetical protein